MQFSSMKTALKRNKLMAICYGWHSGALTNLRTVSAKLTLARLQSRYSLPFCQPSASYLDQTNPHDPIRSCLDPDRLRRSSF